MRAYFLTESTKDRKSSQIDWWSSFKKCLRMFISLSTLNLFFWPLSFHIAFQFFHHLQYFHMLWTHELSATVVNHAIRTHSRVKPKFLGTQNLFIIYLYTVFHKSRWWLRLNLLVAQEIQTIINKTSALTSSISK